MTDPTTPEPAVTPAEATPYVAAAQPAPYTAPATAARPYNVLAIIALIGAFVFPLVGIIVGAIALGQIKKTGDQGRGLALAGLILGIVFTLFYIIFGIIWIIFVALATTAGYGVTTY